MKIITIEEHFTSASVSKKMMQVHAAATAGKAADNHDLELLLKHYLPTNDDIEDVGTRRIAFMDKSGVDVQVIGYGGGSPDSLPDPVAAAELCQEANEELAGYISINPTRFAGFATLPVADPEAAAAELERAVKILGFKGAMLSGTLQGQFLDGEKFFPIFAKAAELDVPVYMHPGMINKNVADYYFKDQRWPALVNGIFPASGYGWHMDSGMHVFRIILSGTFDRLPNLQLISGHWGEFAPFFLTRINKEISPSAKHLNRPIAEYYKSNVYITPSGIFENGHLEFAISVMGADRIIYSADYPYIIDGHTRDFLVNSTISSIDKEKIAHLNAERLFKLPQA